MGRPIALAALLCFFLTLLAAFMVGCEEPKWSGQVVVPVRDELGLPTPLLQVALEAVNAELADRLPAELTVTLVPAVTLRSAEPNPDALLQVELLPGAELSAEREGNLIRLFLPPDPVDWQGHLLDAVLEAAEGE